MTVCSAAKNKSALPPGFCVETLDGSILLCKSFPIGPSLGLHRCVSWGGRQGEIIVGDNLRASCWSSPSSPPSSSRSPRHHLRTPLWLHREALWVKLMMLILGSTPKHSGDCCHYLSAFCSGWCAAGSDVWLKLKRNKQILSPGCVLLLLLYITAKRKHRLDSNRPGLRFCWTWLI